MQQFANFLLAGGSAALLNWGSRFLFSLWFSLEWAVIFAFFIGLISGFLLMRTFVFSSRDKAIAPQMTKYAVVNFLALLQTLIITMLLARWFFPLLGWQWYSDALAHLVGVVVPVITSYFGHKFLTFR